MAEVHECFWNADRSTSTPGETEPYEHACCQATVDLSTRVPTMLLEPTQKDTDFFFFLRNLNSPKLELMLACIWPPGHKPPNAEREFLLHKDLTHSVRSARQQRGRSCRATETLLHRCWLPFPQMQSGCGCCNLDHCALDYSPRRE